jgi:transcriptional regulator with XRE-family HTH domain
MSAQTSLNQRLRDARHRAGLRATEAAARADISYPYLRALEAGTKVPSLGVLERLAAVYETSMAELFGPLEAAS